MRKTTSIDADDALFIESIYREYHQLMFSVAGRFGLSAADQEDVVSEAMIWFLSNISTLQKIAPEKQQYYIVRAVISVSVNCLRKQKAHLKKRSEGLTDTAQTDISLEEQVILKTELFNVINSIMSLPYKESQCIRLKYLSGCTNAEIAERTGLSENSVNQYIMRARKHIRTTLYSDEES